MGRRVDVTLNDAHELLRPLLMAIKALRQHYRSVDAGSISDHHVTEIKMLLREEAVSAVLTQRLAEQPRPGRPLSEADVKGKLAAQEAKLGPHFGYEEKEVAEYLKRACKQGGPAEARASIETVEDLVLHLEAIHARLKADLAVDVKRFKKRAALKQARRRAQDGLFHFGAIVADGSRATLFKLSYEVGTTGLGREPVHG